MPLEARGRLTEASWLLYSDLSIEGCLREIEHRRVKISRFQDFTPLFGLIDRGLPKRGRTSTCQDFKIHLEIIDIVTVDAREM